MSEQENTTPKIGTTVRMVSPRNLGTLEKFELFSSTTFPLSVRERRAIIGARTHFEKAVTLANLARKLVPNIDIDEDQLRQMGFTPATNAKEVCTLVEASILEIYASLDCTRQVWIACFKGSRVRTC